MWKKNLSSEKDKIYKVYNWARKQPVSKKTCAWKKTRMNEWVWKRERKREGENNS